MRHLPDEDYARIEASIPILCVDFVPYRVAPDGLEVGLIRRASPFGEVWCHLGGRVWRGETVRAALLRHASDTLDVTLDLDDDPQPARVHQWFPPEDTPADAARLRHGVDPRKHAIGLSFAVRMRGQPAPRDEARAFAWFPAQELPRDAWPGSPELVTLLAGTVAGEGPAPAESARTESARTDAVASSDGPSARSAPSR